MFTSKSTVALQNVCVCVGRGEGHGDNEAVIVSWGDCLN